MKELADMAMIDAPDGARYYFLPPVLPDVYNPSIMFHRGAVRACYVIPSRLGAGSIYSEGREITRRKLRELQGIHAALGILCALWEGILAKHQGAAADLLKQERLARVLVGDPEGAFALIEKSGVLGKRGMPKKAANLLRNVMALAHWKAVWQLRTPGKGVMANGRRSPGGINWPVAADYVNHACRAAFPDIASREWNDFTWGTLKKLMADQGWDQKARF